MSDRSLPSDELSNLPAAYEQICSSYRAIDTFRGTLLGLLPLASGAGIFLLLGDALTKGEDPALSRQFLLPIGAFGFAVTLGLYFYELRGIQYCIRLICAGQNVEQKLKVPGWFSTRPRKDEDVAGFISEIPAAHLIYAAVLAAWTFVAAVFSLADKPSDPAILRASLLALAVFSSVIVFALLVNLWPTALPGNTVHLHRFATYVFCLMALALWISFVLDFAWPKGNFLVPILVFFFGLAPTLIYDSTRRKPRKAQAEDGAAVDGGAPGAIRQKMTQQLLQGKRIAVLVESKFIPEEIEAYRSGFALLGAEVDFISRLWGQKEPCFYSDVDPLDSQPWESPLQMVVKNDLPSANELLSRYAAIIMAANYTSVRLRWEALEAPSLKEVNARTYVQSPPAVKLFAAAMENERIVKGALCHGLWLLTPHPKLLRGCKVTCHTVVMADILNCKAEVQFEEYEDGGTTKVRPALVVTDAERNLVTGYSKHEVVKFIQAIADQILAVESQPGQTHEKPKGEWDRIL